MHDTLISKDIIEAAQKQGKVKRITVEVGELGHVPKKELEETLKNMVPDWELCLMSKEALCECSCGFTGRPKIIEHSHGHSIYACPDCGAVPKLTQGQHIILKSVEVE